jgi:hypothetical protein
MYVLSIHLTYMKNDTFVFTCLSISASVEQENVEQCYFHFEKTVKIKLYFRVLGKL